MRAVDKELNLSEIQELPCISVASHVMVSLSDLEGAQYLSDRG